MAPVTRSEMFFLDSSPFDTVFPFRGVNESLVSQDLPEDLKAAYKEIHALCETLDTPPNTHTRARERYESVYQLGSLASEPQKTVIAGCLFIAYEATDRNGIGERKISYYERSILAPPADHGVRRVIAALDRIFTSETARNSRVLTRAPHEETYGWDSIVDDPVEPLLAVHQTIESFAKHLPISSHTVCYATAHTKKLYEEVHGAGGFGYSEQPAVVAGCFHIALLQLKVPLTFWETRLLTGIPVYELEAVVKDLDNFFAEGYKLEQNDGQEMGHPLHSSEVTNPVRATEAEGPAHV